MEILKDGIDRLPPGERAVVTIGSYDGIHRGHRLVLGRVIERAQSRGAKSVVITFDKHPASVVQRPLGTPLLLTDFEQRKELFAELGFDYLYLLSFDETRSQTSALDFVKDVLVSRLGALEVIVGEDFRFGHNRQGNVGLLHSLSEQYGFEVVGLELLSQSPSLASSVVQDDEPISSTRIRAKLQTGDIAAVNNMLGRLFEVRSVVCHGNHRGRVLGFPTANLAVPLGYAWPAIGVYAAVVQVAGSRHMAAVNIGVRPTFADQDADKPELGAVLEAHLIDFSGDLYDQEMHVAFVKRLRSEQKFDSLQDLKDQLVKDIEDTKAALQGIDLHNFDKALANTASF